MTTEKQIQIIVERNIPLDPNCELKRKVQMKQRIDIRLQMEELCRLLQQVQPFEPRLGGPHFEPRTQSKDHPQY